LVGKAYGLGKYYLSHLVICFIWVCITSKCKISINVRNLKGCFVDNAFVMYLWGGVHCDGWLFMGVF